MVLEVVSDSSEQEDLVQLVDAYARAAIPEYWIVDARRERITFRILALAGGSYVEAPARDDGFVDSAVWGRSCRIARSTNPAGWTTYELAVDPVA